MTRGEVYIPVVDLTEVKTIHLNNQDGELDSRVQEFKNDVTKLQKFVNNFSDAIKSAEEIATDPKHADPREVARINRILEKILRHLHGVETVLGAYPNSRRGDALHVEVMSDALLEDFMSDVELIGMVLSEIEEVFDVAKLYKLIPDEDILQSLKDNDLKKMYPFAKILTAIDLNCDKIDLDIATIDASLVRIQEGESPYKA